MYHFEFKLTSSLEKNFFSKPVSIPERNCASMFKNEIHAFQLIAWAEWISEDESNIQRLHARLEVDSVLSPWIKVYSVGYVPSILPSIQVNDDDDYITKTPGLFPDPLYRIRDNLIELANNQSRSFWFEVAPQGAVTGTYPISIHLFSECGEEIGAANYTLKILDAELPKLDIGLTQWFHGDCIAKLHNVEVQSDAYFEIVEKYIEVYAKFGHNTILTPVLTPAMDTAIGDERPTNQLVDIQKDGMTYSFEFSKLKRWINLCRKHGIEYYEISPICTQWGAAFAPKVMATLSGKYQRIFGWETSSTSSEYLEFLNQFLNSLTQFLRQENILKNCIFHVSDEPSPEHVPKYKAVKNCLLQYVDESQHLDAIADYAFYEKGIIKTPIICNDHISPFLEHKVSPIWTYYCMAQRKHVANKFMAMPSYRNRVLGYQLYKHNIRGFATWGFNFWFTQLSKDVLNPYLDTCCGGAFPSGDAFVVYPLDFEGEVVCSLRLFVFNEAFQDYRALRLLEMLTDRATVEALLNEIIGFDTYPRNSTYYLELRETINQLIEKAINKTSN